MDDRSMSMKIDNWSTVDSALEALRDNDKADVEHYIRELDRENNELLRDKERLEWLVDNASVSMPTSTKQ